MYAVCYINNLAAFPLIILISLWILCNREFSTTSSAVILSGEFHPPVRQLFPHPVQSVFAVSPDMRALICADCLKWAVNCHRSVMRRRTRFSRRQNPQCASALPKWLIVASLYGNMGSSYTLWMWSIFAVSESFDVALISCVIWGSKEQSNII